MFCHFSRVWLFTTPWTVARQAPLTMGFPRQEYWSELPCPPLGDLSDPGIEPMSHTSCTGRRVLYHECPLGSPGSPWPEANLHFNVSSSIPSSGSSSNSYLLWNKYHPQGCIRMFMGSFLYKKILNITFYSKISIHWNHYHNIYFFFWLKANIKNTLGAPERIMGSGIASALSSGHTGPDRSCFQPLQCHLFWVYPRGFTSSKHSHPLKFMSNLTANLLNSHVIHAFPLHSISLFPCHHLLCIRVTACSN